MAVFTLPILPNTSYNIDIGQRYPSNKGEKSMSEMNKINFEELEEVTGGKIVTVENNAVNYANLRYIPGSTGRIAGKAYNGTKLRISGRRVKKDGYVWYEATLLDGTETVWVAGSLIGF